MRRYPGYPYRYSLFFSGCLGGLEWRMGAIDGGFGEMSEVVDIFIVLRYLNEYW